MRINVYIDSAFGSQGLTSPGFHAQGPVILQTNPTLDNHASTKQYVDNKSMGLSASGLTGSTPLSFDTLMNISGDITFVDNNGTVGFTNNAVSNGWYSRVQVNLKGVVTGVNPLNYTDIPDIDWSQITLDKPSTLSGYGITDAIGAGGGTIAYNIKLDHDPVSNTEIATKRYAQAHISSGSSGMAPGDVMYSYVSETPLGFLRCNGGSVSRITYPELFSSIGYGYTQRIPIGGGVPWDQQYNIKTNNLETFGAWIPGVGLPVQLSGFSLLVTKDRIFTIGGYSSGSVLSKIHTAPLNNDGTIGTWSEAGNIPTPLYDTSLVVTKNKVYLMGGKDTANNNVNTVYSTSINTDGTLGSWSSETSFGLAKSACVSFITNGYIYLLGGTNSTIYRCSIDTDGNMSSSWIAVGNIPINSIEYSSIALTLNKVYLIGGKLGATVLSTVYVADIDNNGVLGSWSVNRYSLPISLYKASVLVTKNSILVFGGTTDGTTGLRNLIDFKLNVDGTTEGTIANTTFLPANNFDFKTLITSAKFYTIGGNGTSNTYLIPVTGGGTNDYSIYYNNDSNILDTNYFNIPDLTGLFNINDISIYIKY